MTMCTFAQLRRSGNARRMNCGWTGGELMVVQGDGGPGEGLVVEFSCL
jgi:hypothetical protein